MSNVIINLPKRLKSSYHWLDINNTIVIGLLAKFVHMLAAPMTMVLISLYYTPELQGYYYTFNALLGFQFLADLSFATVVIQFAAHEYARLSISTKGFIKGPYASLNRVRSLSRFVFKWYGVAGMLSAIILGIIGYYYFKQNVTTIAWTAPWFCLCFFMGFNIFMMAPLALLEGFAQVNQIYRYRLKQNMTVHLATWLAIMLGANLWVIVIANAAITACAIRFVYKHYKHLFISLLWPKLRESTFTWRTELMPMQWRMAISTIASYGSTALFIPMLFHFQGAELAGQMGMTWYMLTLIQVSTLWLHSQVPQFGRLVSKGQYDALDALFKNIAWRVFVVSCILILIIMCAVYVVNHYDIGLAQNLLSVTPTFYFCLGVLFSIIGMPFAMYLRAHKVEVVMPVYIGAAVLVMSATYWTARYYSVTEMGLAFSLINLMALPCIVIYWARYRMARLRLFPSVS